MTLITKFPPKMYNKRVRGSIKEFYNKLQEIFQQKNWKWIEPKPSRNDHEQWNLATEWHHPDADIKIISYFPDGAINSIKVTYKRLPGFVRPRLSKSALRFTHSFEIKLPRSYPANLSAIKLYSLDYLYHPRMSSSRGMKMEACIHIPGEIDRILIEFIYQILMKPDKVRPPSQFSADSGLQPSAMRWYEHNLKSIVKFLEEQWDSTHEKNVITSTKTKRSKVVMLD